MKNPTAAASPVCPSLRPVNVTWSPCDTVKGRTRQPDSANFKVGCAFQSDSAHCKVQCRCWLVFGPPWALELTSKGSCDGELDSGKKAPGAAVIVGSEGLPFTPTPALTNGLESIIPALCHTQMCPKCSDVLLPLQSNKWLEGEETTSAAF